jgi:uncharacterized protein YvpB
MDNFHGSSVLGINTFGPVEGSPLIPPGLLTGYFVVFLAVLLVFYLYLYFKKRPATIWHKFKLLTLTALIIKVVFSVGGGLLAAYWLIPTPSIEQTNPLPQAQNFPTTSKIEIIFDRPVDRSLLQKTITPETPGRWVFEDSIYTTHLYRKLVFYPTLSLKTDTQYNILLSQIQNLTPSSKPTSYGFDFKTQKSPKVVSVFPISGQEEVEITSTIQITLDEANSNVSEFEFLFSPQIPFDKSLDQTKKVYTLTSKEGLKQGTKYTLSIKKTDVTLNLQDTMVTERGQMETEYEGTFTTKQAPGVASFEPQSTTNLPLNTTFQIVFSQEMDRQSVQSSFTTDPKLIGAFSWTDDKTLNFKPQNLEYEKSYTLKIAKGVKVKDGAGFTTEDIVKQFTTIGSPKIIASSPTNNLTAVNINSPVKITFDQAVDQTTAESKFTITPFIEGSFSWSGNTLIFTPTKPLSHTTNYTVILDPGVRNNLNLTSKSETKISFTTADATTKLAVPAYLQKYSLSCEIASLRMALAFKGVNLDEDTIHSQVGQDPTPHQGNIWGNPHGAFVGNINGRFQGWSISQLTESLLAGNPVVIWVYSSGGWPTAWKTPDGLTINAARDEHAVVAVGFVGSPHNPTQLIINDPLVGQVYWNRALFDKKWNIFNRAGVVVR